MTDNIIDKILTCFAAEFDAENSASEFKQNGPVGGMIDGSAKDVAYRRKLYFIIEISDKLPFVIRDKAEGKLELKPIGTFTNQVYIQVTRHKDDENLYEVSVENSYFDTNEDNPFICEYIVDDVTPDDVSEKISDIYRKLADLNANTRITNMVNESFKEILALPKDAMINEIVTTFPSFFALKANKLKSYTVSVAIDLTADFKIHAYSEEEAKKKALDLADERLNTQHDIDSFCQNFEVYGTEENPEGN